MYDQKAQRREFNERLRGWIVYFLYKRRPHPLELPSLMRLLDAKNFPLSRRRLAEEVDYLRSVRLLRIFKAGEDKEVGEIDAAKLIQRYSMCEDDEETGYVLCARITAAGINFQEGLDSAGIARVE